MISADRYGVGKNAAVRQVAVRDLLASRRLFGILDSIVPSLA